MPRSTKGSMKPAALRAPSPEYFATAQELYRWLARHHATAPELWVGFHKKQPGKTFLTYAQALDEALCFGWIDGVRKSVDADRYTIRFTPRTARSKWSAVNIRRLTELEAEGRVHDAGRAAALRLIARADVLVYNIRPAAMARLKLSYDEVRAVNPRILYVGAFGYSQRGPNASKIARK